MGAHTAGIRRDVDRVRVVGTRYRSFTRPKAKDALVRPGNRIATLSVWGEGKQALLESFRIGIAGLGSVGSLVAESLARMGVRDFVLVDNDSLEERNLDRTAGAKKLDAILHLAKVSVAKRTIKRSGTAKPLRITTHHARLQERKALQSLLDCDFIFSCVDRHAPRYVLNYLAYSHLIPVIDGGIHIGLPNQEKPSLDISWRTHLVAPGRPCLECLGAYDYGKVGLEVDGLIDDPHYINAAPVIKKEYDARENVFCFSMSCAAHEVIQFLGYALDEVAVSPAVPQMYFAGSGLMFKAPFPQEEACKPECRMKLHDSKALNLNRLLR